MYTQYVLVTCVMKHKMKGIASLWVFLTLAAALNSFVVNVGSDPTTTFAVEPTKSTGHAGETFTVDVRVYEAYYLYSWQVHMSWDPAVLEYSGYVFGGFLTGQPEGSMTSTRTDHVFDEGWCLLSEATKGQYSGISGDGLLLSVTFLVKTVSATTIAIDHATLTKYVECFVVPKLTQITDFPKENGYYVVPWVEDFNGDGMVDIFDISSVAIHWGETGTPGWIPADLYEDGVIDISDLSMVAVKFGEQYAG